MIAWLCTRLVDFITGISYAQRILLDLTLIDYLCLFWRDLPSAGDKIHDPRIIHQFQKVCDDILNRKTYGELDDGSRTLEDVVNLILLNHNVRDSYRHLILAIVKNCYKAYKDMKLYNEEASNNVHEVEHKELLDGLWVIDNRPLPVSYDISHSIEKNDLVTSSWGLLGFQRPLTDFRSTGLLGLKCLHYLLTNYTYKCKNILNIISNNDKLWFPFAITSINVTSWTLEHWNNENFNIFSFINDNESLEIFFIIHSYIFFKFINHWIKSDPNSLLDFNKVSNEFRNKILDDIKMIIDNYNPYDKSTLTTLLALEINNTV